MRVLTGIGGGSGFQLVGNNGVKFIVTNAHVCQDEKIVGVQDSIGGEVTELRVLWKAVSSDICVIEGSEEFGTLRLAKEVKPYEFVKVIGFPLFYGRVRVDGYLGEGDLVVARVFPGNSGSPVLNVWGEVVGMISQGYNQTNWGVMVPLEELKAVLGYE